MWLEFNHLNVSWKSRFGERCLIKHFFFLADMLLFTKEQREQKKRFTSLNLILSHKKQLKDYVDVIKNLGEK